MTTLTKSLKALGPTSGSISGTINGQLTLETLPVELLFIIAAFLSLADQVALALVSKTGFYRFGPAVSKLKEKKEERLDFLTVLERDGVRNADILCSACVRFHPPRLSAVHGWYFQNMQGMRPCGERFDLRPWPSTFRLISPNLPSHLHFNTIAAVMRSHRHGWTVHPVHTLAASHRTHHRTGYPKLNCYVSCKIVDGRLIVKTQKLMLPCASWEDLQEARPAVLRFLQDECLLRHCCGHIWWIGHYRFVFDEKADLHPAHIWIHHRIWAARPLHPEGYDPRLAYLYRVYGCKVCYTDFALGVVDLPDTRRRLIVLTTWKDLGSGESPSDVRWASHRYHEDQQPNVRKASDLGRVCHKFEEGSIKGLFFFDPLRIHPSSIKDLT